MEKVGRLLRSHNTHILAWCAGVVLLWRAALEILNWGIVPYLDFFGRGPTDGIKLSDGMKRWAYNWDGAWYETIIRHGYIIINHLHGQETIAFFPLYPLTVRFFSFFAPSKAAAVALLLNLVYVIGAAYFVYQISMTIGSHYSKQRAHRIARLAVLMTLLNPAAYFLAAAYAEPLLLLLFSATIYYMLRERYIIAVLLAGLATGTKSIGAILLPIILFQCVYVTITKHKDVHVWSVRFIGRLALMALLGLSGIIAYSTYLFARFRQPLLFLKIQKYWDRDSSGNPFTAIYHDEYQHFFNKHFFGTNINWAYHVFIMLIPILCLALAVFILIRFRMRYAWVAGFLVLLIGVPVATGSLISMNRYALLAAPIYPLAVAYCDTRKSWLALRFLHVGIVLGAAFLAVFAVAFLGSYSVG